MLFRVLTTALQFPSKRMSGYSGVGPLPTSRTSTSTTKKSTKRKAKKNTREPDDHVKQVCQELGLDLDGQSPYLCTKDLARRENSLSQYEQLYRQFWNFCILIGDHRSRVILLEHCPENAPTISIRTFRLFLRKFGTQSLVPLTFPC